MRIEKRQEIKYTVRTNCGEIRRVVYSRSMSVLFKDSDREGRPKMANLINHVANLMNDDPIQKRVMQFIKAQS